MTMIDTNLARAMARHAGLLCMISENGKRLNFYKHEDDETPAGSTLIDDACGYLTVSLNAVEKIIGGAAATLTSPLPETEAAALRPFVDDGSK